MVKKSKKSKNTITIDWSEDEGGKFIKNPGEYIVYVSNVEQDEDDEGKSYISWTFTVDEGKAKGSTISTRTFITPKALWKLRELLQCLGVDVKDNSVQDIDLEDTLESKLVIEVEESNERPDGKGYYMQVSDFMSLEEYTSVNKSSTEKEETSKKSIQEEVDEDELLDKMEDEIDELGLDIDLDDYDTFEEKKKAFEKAKSKAKKQEEKEKEEYHYTIEEIEALGSKQLKVIAEEIGLELDEDASTRSKRKSIISGLRKAGLLDE